VTTPEELRESIVRARRNCYAGGIEEIIDFGFRKAEYQEGKLRYRDIWIGRERFHGWEVVFEDDRPVWSMVYSGGRSWHRPFPGPRLEEIYAFLREALLEKSSVARLGSRVGYRETGYQNGPWTYMDNGRDLEYTFDGVESISWNGEEVYFLHYCGGPIV
jgi:hypothetical protein